MRLKRNSLYKPVSNNGNFCLEEVRRRKTGKKAKKKKFCILMKQISKRKNEDKNECEKGAESFFYTRYNQSDYWRYRLALIHVIFHAWYICW